MIRIWPELRDLALSLDLPEVTVAHAHGHQVAGLWQTLLPWVDACRWRGVQSRERRA